MAILTCTRALNRQYTITYIPGAHLLVQSANVLGKLLHIHIQLLHVNLTPQSLSPFVEGRANQEHTVPQSLQKTHLIHRTSNSEQSLPSHS